jgi:hypothetical protein
VPWGIYNGGAFGRWWKPSEIAPFRDGGRPGLTISPTSPRPRRGGDTAHGVGGAGALLPSALALRALLTASITWRLLGSWSRHQQLLRENATSSKESQIDDCSDVRLPPTSGAKADIS